MRWRIKDDASEHYLEQVAVGGEDGERYSTRSVSMSEQRSATHRDRRTWTWFGVCIDARPKLAYAAYPPSRLCKSIYIDTATTDTLASLGSMSDDEIEIVENKVAR